MRNHIDDIERTAAMLSSARKSAKMSQQDMANVLGVTTVTIRNWEKGYGSPDYPTVLLWLDACGVNSCKYLLTTINPQAFENLFSFDDKGVEEALVYYIREVATPEMKRKMAYNIMGSTGSDWAGQIEMLTAYNRCPLSSRLNIANAVITNYKLALASSQLVGKGNTQPNLPLLERAAIKALEAVLDGREEYTL